MRQKPEHIEAAYAESFKDASVVEAYRYRPPYPAEVFALLLELLRGESRRVLDVGCGTGKIARNLVEHVEQVDAVDFSQRMIEQGKRLPNGAHPGLRWLYGRVEDVALEPPYGLVTAAASLHWMDWHVVLPRFQEALGAGGYLAIVGYETEPDPWSLLSEIIPQYKTTPDYQSYDLIGELEQRGLFTKVGEKRTAPVSFVQSVDDYVESYHSRSGFSRERMGPEHATVFDRGARKILSNSYSDGMIPFQVFSDVVWGLPHG